MVDLLTRAAICTLEVLGGLWCLVGLVLALVAVIEAMRPAPEWDGIERDIDG